MSLTARPGAAGKVGRGEALHVRPELAAEPAAHVVRDALHLGRRHAEPPGELLGGGDGRLRGGPDGQAAVGVPLGDESVRFEALVRDDRHAVGALGDGVGLVEGRVEPRPWSLPCRPEQVPLKRAGRRLLLGVLQHLRPR